MFVVGLTFRNHAIVTGIAPAQGIAMADVDRHPTGRADVAIRTQIRGNGVRRRSAGRIRSVVAASAGSCHANVTEGSRAPRRGRMAGAALG